MEQDNIKPKKYGVITIFPEVFPGPLACSITGRGLKKKKWELEIIDLKKYKVQKKIDDEPFGGGNGMIIRPDVLGNCIEKHKSKYNMIIYPSPKGKPITQEHIFNLSKLDSILFICGRYEGIDERIIEYYNIQQFCVGEIVLCGGELPSMCIIEALARLESIGNSNSLLEESFSISSDMVEHNQYTRPASWNGIEVPSVLRNGNHSLIEKWKKESSLKNSHLRKQKK